MAALRALDYHGAGYREDCSRYVGCHIAGKEEEGICNIFGLCHSAKRNILDDRLDKGIGKNSNHICSGDARGHSIYPYAIFAQLALERFGEAVDSKF